MARTKKLDIKLLQKDIVEVKADVCVTSVHRSKDMTKGPLASHILRNGGQKVKEDLSKVNGTNMLDHGQVAMIPPGNLSTKFSQLMAVCLHCWREGNDETLLIAVQECLELANEKRYKTIVFPALGMGGQKYPPFNVAMAIICGIANFRALNPDSSLQTVYIALHDKDENSIRTFLQTSIAFTQGMAFNDTSDVDLDGVDGFNGLESSKPKTQTETSAMPSLREIVDLASRATQGVPSTLSFSRNFNFGDVSLSVSPNFSIPQRSLGVDVHIDYNFERRLPQILNRLLPRA